MSLPGTNSTKGLTKVDGKQCPIYTLWKNMRERCYCPKYHEGHPTYIGCSVCEEWLEFANFRTWVITQDWKGKQLDKDIITPGNKVYNPEKCVFVSRQLNQLLNDNAKVRGDLPIGVSKHRKKFAAMISIDGDREHIGYFDCKDAAHRAYFKRKIEYIQTFIDQETDLRIIAGLKKHQQRLDTGEA